MCVREDPFPQGNMERGRGIDDLWGWGEDVLTQNPHLRNVQGGKEG